MGDYRENIARARFGPIPAELLRLRSALRGNQEDTKRFILAREGWIPPENFFNPENLERIFVNAGRRSVLPERTPFMPEPNHGTEAAKNV